VKALVALWDDYVRKNNVILPSRSMFETLDDQLPKRVPDDPGYRRSSISDSLCRQGDDGRPQAVSITDPGTDQEGQKSLEKKRRSHETGCVVVVGRCNDTCPGALCPTQALPGPGPLLLKTLSDANAVPVIVNSISGNTNPFDPSHTVTAGADFDATVALAGYARTFSLFDRAAMAAILLPMGASRAM